MSDTSRGGRQHSWSPLRSTAWRGHLREWWRKSRWPVIAGLWVIALALGYCGFARRFRALSEPRSPQDLLYLSLQLFTLESGAHSEFGGWQLDLARFLAPAVAAYTALQALAHVFFEQIQGLRLSLLRDHIIVCGLSRKGFLLARALVAGGDRVVVIEQDADNTLLQACRDLGIPTLVGDATHDGAQRRAGVRRARHLIGATGSDSTNAQIAMVGCQLTRGRPGVPLTCVVHIVDPLLSALLRERELAARQDGSCRLSFFNTFDVGARALLDQYPPFDADASTAASRPPHILVVGLGSMGQSLVVDAARRWRGHIRRAGLTDAGSQASSRAPNRSEQSQSRSPQPARLRVTIVDREAQKKTQALQLRHVQLSASSELIAVQVEIRSPEFQRAEFLYGADGTCDISRLYVCLDNDSLGLSAALSLLQHVRGQGTPIVVRAAEEAGLAALLGGPTAAKGSFSDLHAFALQEHTCQPELWLGGAHEILARAIHEEHIRHQTSPGQTSQANPSLVPWDELPLALRESTRAQADHVAAKLVAVGCEMEPLTDWDSESFVFSDAEIETMARMEHEGFANERRLTARAPAAIGRGRSPGSQPLSWEQLPEEDKELDRALLRQLPRLLAKAGLQVRRTRRTSSPPHHGNSVA